MGLTDIEKYINSADILYSNTDQKLAFVNVKLGYGKAVKNEMGKLSCEPFPKYKDDLIPKWKYYHIRKTKDSNTKKRGQSIARNRYASIINEFDFLESSRSEINRLQMKAEAAEKWSATHKFMDLQFKVGQRIAALAEAIFYVQQDPTHITQELEMNAEKEEYINEQIRLYSNLT